MPAVSFGDFEYVPVISTGEVERIAYNQLRPDTRAGILPVFELSRYRGAENLNESIAMVGDIVQNAFLLDLDKRYAPAPYQSQNPANPAAEQQRVERETQENDAYNSFLQTLLSPNNGFQNWRQVCAGFDNAVPVLQYTNPQIQANSIIRQASLLSQGGNSIAIRIGQVHTDSLIVLASQILAALPSSGQLLIIFDCGQGRRGVAEKAEWILASLNTLMAALEPEQIVGLSVVCMSNSYPQMTHDGLRIVDNCDREIWRQVFSEFPFHFGDYAATTRTASLSAFMPRTFRATVVHSLDEQWLVHRHENSDDPDGWVVGSQVIVGNDIFDPTDSWTDQSIQQVALGNLGDMNVPRRWHASKIAGHIDRQFRYQPPYDEFEDLLG